MSNEMTKDLGNKLWRNCVESWLDSRRAPNTKRAYKIALDDFLHCEATSLQDAVPSHFVEWKKIMMARGLKAASINARLGALNSLYHFAETEESLSLNNPVNIRRIRQKVTTYANSRALSVGEVKKLLAQPDKSSVTGMRDFALISGYVILGRRNTEWRLARVNDFEFYDGKIFFRWSGKGKTNELLSVPKELWAVLQHYISESGGRGPFDYVFRGRGSNNPISMKRVLTIVKRYAGMAGIDGNLRVHDLRHTAALLRREAGADVEEIRDFLGHSDLKTTQIYLHRIERNENFRGNEVCKLISVDTVNF